MTERHAHEWTYDPDPLPTSPWACADCGERSATCSVKRRSDPEHGHPSASSLLICEACLEREHRVLLDIRDALAQHVTAAPSAVRAARYDRDRPGGQGKPAPDHREHRPSNSTPDDVMGDLWSWAEMWREKVGDDLTRQPWDYLAGHLLWAAHQPEASAWDDYRSEVGQLRHDARRIAGLLPAREPTPCVYCGGTVVRDWSDETWTALIDGLSDVVRCTGCAMTWGDETRFRFAARTHLRALPAVDPELLVTLDEARACFPGLPRTTLISWVKRDEEAVERAEVEDREHDRALPRRGWSVRGEPTYRLGDISALVERRSSGTRRGRPAGRAAHEVA